MDTIKKFKFGEEKELTLVSLANKINEIIEHQENVERILKIGWKG